MKQNTMPGVGESEIMNDSFKKIGMSLQAARKSQGLRTPDVARELRISADYLRLLESGDFDELPAPTYVSGFLRSYGKFLGLDGADLAGRFYAIKGDVSSAIAYKLPLTAGPPQRSAPAVASLFVVLALIGYGGWYLISGPATRDATDESKLAAVDIDNKQPDLMTENAIGKRFETASMAISDTLPGDRNSLINTTKGVVAEQKSPFASEAVDDSMGTSSGLVNEAENASGTTTLASALTDSNEQVMNGAVEGAVTPNISTATPSSRSLIDGDEATLPVTDKANRGITNDVMVNTDVVQQLVPGRAAAVATLRDPDQEVTIRAKASSWVEIVRGDGTAILKKLMKAGETFVVDDGSALYLSTGNAGGIELVTAGNNIITIGTVGEIVRDLPLARNRLRDRL